MTNLMNKLFIAAAGCAMMSSAAVAQAPSHDPELQSTFSFNADAPVEVIYNTIEKQAKKSCRNEIRGEKILFRIKRKHMKVCQATMLKSAVDQIRNPKLTQFHAERTG